MFVDEIHEKLMLAHQNDHKSAPFSSTSTNPNIQSKEFPRFDPQEFISSLNMK